MNSVPSTPDPLHHHSRPMSGRDPHEAHRVATPLELLFDLTFGTAFGLAASQFAQALAEGHFGAAFLGFSFASFAICWAWVNFSWFASAYDTDDWIFRLATMVQMIGVLVVTIGLPRMFASIWGGVHLDNRIMVLGYVIMRIAMVFQWLRAAKQDPKRRRSCLTYAITISIAQAGWVTQILVGFSVGATVALTGALVILELAGPVIAERKDGGTPWHAHHIAERYSLFAIIALGEEVVGTVAALSAVVEQQGWTMDAALVCIAGVGLTFGMWWVYYLLPSAQALHTHRSRAFAWGFGQIVVVASIVATGAGLRVAAYFIAHKAHISPLDTVFIVAIPVVIYMGSLYALYYYLVRQFDLHQVGLLIATVGVVAIAVVAALSRVNMAVCLMILVLAPVVTIVGYEVLGYHRQADALRNNPRKRNHDTHGHRGQP
jgi:low temperature requirement protein LtrA